MQVSVETTSGLERRMTVQIPKDKLDQEVQVRLKQLAGKAKIQGFRPGKVPMNVIKQRYGGQVEQEVMGELIQSSYVEALTQENLRPAGMPHIQPAESTSESGEMTYTATFEVYPEIAVKGLENIKVEQPVLEISEQDMDEMLETIRKQRKQWKEADKAAENGDRVVIDFEGFMDGEAFEGGTAQDYALELGAKRMIPGFEDQLVGIKAGEERSINVKFPADYHAKNLADKDVEFKVKAHKVEAPELPELNDEFAESFGITEGGLDKLREQVKENMEREAKQKIRSQVKQQVLDGIVEQNPVDLPKVLIDGEIEHLMQQQRQAMGLSEGNQTQDIDPKLFEDQARRRVALGLILSELIKQNEIKVEPAKLREAIENIAASYERPEEVVKYYYGDKERLSEIENLVLEDEAIDWVVTQASVTDKKTTFNELMNPTAAG
ncbi:MAG: trigger factor [Gammaproteobacteria bacterium SG8_15]|nr:MAG: trigger factor [Gammaproteobacteria bacterium SG8_15]